MKQSLSVGSEQQVRQSQTTANNRSATSEAQSFVDNRPQTIAQRQLINTIHASPQMIAQRKQAGSIHDSPRMAAQRELSRSLQSSSVQLKAAPEEEMLQGKFEAVQRVEEDELLQGKFAVAQRVEAQEPLQGKFDVAQRVEEEELLQGKSAAETIAQRVQQPTKKTNNTGLPDNLKSGIEHLSGMSMDHVKVHYNSSQPAQLNALAYAQGADIHVAPGQEQHLPHEAWHVVQQAQGRVRPTMQMRGSVPVNDDAGLEREADVMGAKALGLNAEGNAVQRQLLVPNDKSLQLKWNDNGNQTYFEDETGENFNAKTRSYTGEQYSSNWQAKELTEEQAAELMHVIAADLVAVEVEAEAEAPVDPYAAPQILSNGTTVDWPALTEVMEGVELGTEVAPGVWRAMRQSLSNAIVLPNKSHPAHGSNFDKKQRPEQQIKDWATPIAGPLRTALEAYFVAKYNLYL